MGCQHEEAAKGNKPSNTFRVGSFALVAKEISTQFKVECHPSYVENRLADSKDNMEGNSRTSEEE